MFITRIYTKARDAANPSTLHRAALTTNSHLAKYINGVEVEP